MLKTRSSKRLRRRFNLRTRFLLAFIGFISVLTLLIAAFVSFRFASDMERQIEQNGKVLADILAKEAFLQTVVRGQTNLAFVAESFVGGEVLFVQIVHNGVELTQKTTVPVDLSIHSILPGQHIRRGVLPGGTAYVDITRSFLGRITPAERGLQRELVDSYVRLGFSFGRVHEEIEQDVFLVAFAALGVIMLGSLLVLIYYQKTWRPLERINEAMHLFGQGETGVRAHVHSRDELETLARSFNEMADSIVKKDEQMIHVNLEMQRANRAKSDFLAAMSHDLKTPLHVIAGYAQLMLEGDGGAPTDVQKSHLGGTLRAADRLLEFIERILSFSKIESGEEPLRCKPVNVQALTAEVVESLQPLAQQKGLDLSAVIETQTTLNADTAKMKQVLSNLIENAIKYTETGSVKVRVYQKNAGVFWTIQDSGPGIPKRYETFIFEPFGRLHSTHGRMAEGMGLGLAIVKRYVELHRGRVSVKSVPGQGSTFVVFIPGKVIAQ